MKVNVIGIEHSQGISAKGEPYNIGKLYAALMLVGKGVRGFSGTEYRCEPVVLDKLKDVELPCVCELEIQDVIRWGKRQQEVVAVTPVGKAAAPLPKAA